VTRIEVADYGSGPAVMLLHAFPCDHHMWDEQVDPIVAAGWRVLIPDLPGFGASELPAAAQPDLGEVVDELHTFSMDRGVDRLVVVGLSVGGYLAMEWLRRYPEMLAGVGLFDTKATADASEARGNRVAMADAIDVNPAGCAELLRERVLPVILGSSSHESRPDVVAQVETWMRTADPMTVAWYQRAMADRPDSVQTLSSVDVPALVLWGEEDVMSPAAEQRIMLDVLRDARSASIPGAGHLSAIEQPEPVARELVDFLTRVQRAGISG